MDTRHLLKWSFGGEFLAICNHCAVMAAWSRKTLSFWKFLRFLEKRPITVNISKFCSESFHSLNDRGVVLKCREIWQTGNRWKKFRRAASQTVATAGSRPKSARVSLQQCAQSAPDFVQIGSLWAEFIVERVNTAKTRRKVNQYSAEA